MTHRQKMWRMGVWRLCLGTLCWLLAAGALATQSLWFPAEILRYHSPLSFAYTDLPALRQALAETPGAQVSAFSQSLEQKLSVPALESALTGDVLWVDGPSALVWDVEMIAGQPLQEGDRTGCVISRRTAMRLFGSMDVVGQTLRVGEAELELEVRGVYEPPSSPTSWGADPGREWIFASAAEVPKDHKAQTLHFTLPGLSFADGQDAALLALGDCGMDVSGSFSDDRTGQGIRRFLVSLVGLWMLVLAVVALARTAWVRTARQLRVWQAWRADPNPAPGFARRFALGSLWQGLPLLAGAVLLLLLPVSRLFPPASYVPTRWSDFAFWPSLLGRLSQALAASRMSGGMRPLLQMQSLSLLCVGLCAVALGCCVSGARLVRWSAASQGVWRVLLSLLCLGAMAPLGGLLCRAVGWTVDDSLFQALLAPLWLALLCLEARTLAAREMGKEAVPS